MIDLDLLVILDRSGSMQDRKADHEGGVRAFVEDQRTLAGDVRFTLVQFDTTDPCEIVYGRVPLDTVGAITLVPRGGTPLLDAVGGAIAYLRTAQAREPSAQTVVLVVTDGQENASTEWTKARVTALVDEVEAGGAKVLFLGADLSTFAEAQAMGVSYVAAMAVPQGAANIRAAYAITSSKVKDARDVLRGGGSFTSASACMNYSDEDRIAVSTATDDEP